MQTKLESFLETLLNVLSGMLVAYVVALYTYPMFGLTVSPTQNLAMTSIFTVFSIVRTYIWRRFFNKRLINKYKE